MLLKYLNCIETISYNGFKSNQLQLQSYGGKDKPKKYSCPTDSTGKQCRSKYALGLHFAQIS